LSKLTKLLIVYEDGGTREVSLDTEIPVMPSGMVAAGGRVFAVPSPGRFKSIGLLTSRGNLIPITVKPFEFTLSIYPRKLNLMQGSSISIPIKVLRNRGVLRRVLLSLIHNLPEGVSLHLSRAEGLSYYEAQLTITAGLTATPGTYSITVKGETEGAEGWEKEDFFRNPHVERSG